MTSTPKERSTEVRLGLVMCGGVSLAIYINGISNELFRSVRGRGIYGLLKELTDSDVIVDILSGSSAGGLNAILLGTALCNSSEFGTTADFWRHKADFDQLLEPPASHAAILSGSYHQTQLRAALTSLMDGTQRIAGDELESKFTELDLFITGTDVNGRQTTRLDDASHPVLVTDYRTLFWLKHRQDRKEPFNPLAAEKGGTKHRPEKEAAALAGTNAEALAKLGRITASFPAAFEPVIVNVSPSEQPGPSQAEPLGSADSRLAHWGQLTKTAVLIDGGVLDNKPFTGTLEAIFSRLSERPVTRHLFFVEPDPAESIAARSGQPKPDVQPAVVPGFVKVIIDSLSTLPSYDSVADDLKALSEHNAQLIKYRELVAAVAPGAGSSNEQRAVHDKARRCALAETWLQAVLEDNPEPAARRQRLASQSHLQESLQALRDFPALLEELDVDFRLRRLYALTYYQVEPAAPHTPGTVTLRAPGRGEFQVDQALFALLNRQIELLIVVRSRMRARLARFGKEARHERALLNDPKEFWSKLVLAMGALLHELEAPASYANPAAYEKCVSKDELELLAKGSHQGGASFSLVDSDSFELAALSANANLRAAYLDFLQVDELAFPMEVASELHEKDEIRPVRISPYDAQRGLSRTPDKLCGVKLLNFGGFLKRSWRSNDNLWGRLDAVCELTETLLDPRRLRQPAVRAKLRTLGRLPARVDQLFPTSSEQARASLKHWLTRLTGQPEQQEQALSELEASVQVVGAPGILEELVLAAQLEVLRSDLLAVLHDDIDEASGIGPQRKAAAARLREVTPHLADGRGEELARFFRNQYAVPTQRLTDVSWGSLAKWGVRFAFGFGAGLFSAGSRALPTGPAQRRG